MCIRPQYIYDRKNRKSHIVPCGKCFACLQNRAANWFFRLFYESKSWTYTYFITLTYDDEKVPYKGDYPTLFKKDVQDFMKRVRKVFKIKYYVVGEYGKITARPHYHAIIFTNKVLDDNFILSKWNNGHITSSMANARRLRYICKYHLNRGDKPNNVVNDSFNLMSKGIGISYVEIMKNYHNLSNSYVSYYEKRLPMPRYYKEKIYTKREREIIADSFSPSFEELDKKLREYKKKFPNSSYFKYILLKNEEKQRIFELNLKRKKFRNIL